MIELNSTFPGGYQFEEYRLPVGVFDLGLDTHIGCYVGETAEDILCICGRELGDDDDQVCRVCLISDAFHAEDGK